MVCHCMLKTIYKCPSRCLSTCKLSDEGCKRMVLINGVMRNQEFLSWPEMIIAIIMYCSVCDSIPLLLSFSVKVPVMHNVLLKSKQACLVHNSYTVVAICLHHFNPMYKAQRITRMELLDNLHYRTWKIISI